jgi:hypothetical protein
MRSLGNDNSCIKLGQHSFINSTIGPYAALDFSPRSPSRLVLFSHPENHSKYQLHFNNKF